MTLGGSTSSPSSGGANTGSASGNDGSLTITVTPADSSASGSTDTSGPTLDPGSDTTVDTPPSSNTQLAQSDANAHQSDAQNGNVSVRVGQGGDTGNVTQGNQASSSASSSATGNLASSGTGPSATASADTTQSSPSNTNVAVLVGSPGDLGTVGQQNNANAGAAAVGSTAADGTGGGQAIATADQISPSNVNVVVRVGSPGDNGGVTQTNTVGATAGPNLGSTATTNPTTVASTPAATDQTVTTSGQSNLANTGTVDQELLQTQDGDGPDVSADVIPDDAVPTASTGTATATQTGAQNINVSIRIGSPGKDGATIQANGATATGTSPGLSIIDKSDGTNLNLTIVLPGSAAGAPGDDWAWNWTWTGDGTPPANSTATTAAPTTGSTWNWSWAPTPAATPPSAVSTANSSSTGMFTWNWNWILPDGQLWTLTQQTACACNWQWNWNWDWSTSLPQSQAATTATGDPSGVDGAPADTTSADSAPTLSYDSGPVDQSNSVSASAEASARISFTNLLALGQTGADPSLEMQDAEQGQTFANTQLPTAAAEADQLHPSNLNYVWGVPVASVSQANAVVADAQAAATASLDQELIQYQDGVDTAYQWVGAQQIAVNTQSIAAGVEAAQVGAGNSNYVVAPSPNQAAVGAIEQANDAVTSAIATATAILVQQLAQLQDASEPGLELISAIQLLSVIQETEIAAIVGQTGTWNVDELVVPAGSRATNPTVRQRNFATATTSADDWADVGSVGFQYQGGATDIELTSASQEIAVIQSAFGYSPAAQANLRNYATWLGVEPPPPPAPDGGGSGDEPAGGDSSTSGTPIASTASINTPGVALAAGAAPFVAPASANTAASADTKPPRVPSTADARRAHVLPAVSPTIVGGGPSSLTPPNAVPGPSGSSTPPGAVTNLETPPTAGSLGVDSNGKTAERAGAGAPAQPPTSWPPTFPNDPFSAGAGTSGSAPTSGSGQTVLASGQTKLVAQVVIGPQMPASVLGRPMVFLDPFERPG